MSHNLDVTNGQASFVSAREDAWHQLGVTLPDTFTAEEAMSYGLLGGWNVRKEPVFTEVAGSKLVIPDRYAVVRDNPVTHQPEVLGNVGKVYTVVQNEEHASILDALVDESGAHFETAGAIDGGRKVFITMKLPGHLLVGGVDRVDNYIAAVNTHDGSMQFTLMVTPVRIVCQNTLNLAFGQASHTFRVKHTRNADKLIRAQARQALDLSFKYLGDFQDEAERLINATLTQAQFEEIILREFGPAEDAAPATVTRTERKLEEMSRLFAEANTQEGIRETAWAGLNALVEWADHFAPTRGDDRDGSRARGALLDPWFKNRALEVMRQAAGISA